MKTPIAIDLFSGCGGLSLGLKKGGFEVRAAVEIDPLAAATYRRNHRTTILVQDDIRNISGLQLKQAASLDRGSLDLLAGCPPCQGFSRIRSRNRASVDDPKNDLIFEFLRLTKELRPKMLLLENVPGICKDRRFARILEEIRRIGYWYDRAVADAAHYGVPQRRKRLILMASRLGPIKVPAGRGRRKTVRDYIENLNVPSKTNDALQRMHQKSTVRVKAMISRIPRNGGSRAALGPRSQLACHKRIAGFRDVYGRMRWDDVAPTLTGGCFNPSKGRFLHPVQNRAITLREAALLQTFPRSYHFPTEAGLGAIARLIGDALPPVFAAAQGQHLRTHLVATQR